METDPVRATENALGAVAEQLTVPGTHECLPCYVVRMVEEFGCDGRLRWAEHWRDRNAPRATALARRLSSKGGFCDCEVLYNVHPQVIPGDDGLLLPCLGVGRRGSIGPCRPGSRR